MRGKNGFKKIDLWFGVPLVWLAGMLSRIGSVPAPRPLGPGDRVLVVKLSALGDTLLLLPVTKALKRSIGPQGRLVALGTPINQAALEGNPFIDRLFTLDFGKLFRHPFGFLRMVRELRRERVRVALDFDQWLRISPLLSWLSGAAVRYGFKTRGQFRHFLYIRHTPNPSGKHETGSFADLAALAGIGREEIEAYPGFLEREGLFGVKRPRPGGERPIVHLHPGCGAHGWQREWPAGSYIGLVQALMRRGPVRIRLTGAGKHEEDLVRRIVKDCGPKVEDHLGYLSLDELSGLLREADLVVCGNTGIMHLAAGLGRPLVALHGPTDPVKWGPLGPAATTRVVRSGLLCSPCLNLGFEYGCPYRSCMESVDQEMVYKECLKVLALVQ